MKKFNLKIITPLEIVFEGKIRLITFTTIVGARGLLPDHLPFMAPLIAHVLKIWYNDKDFDFYSVKEGFIQFINNNCIVLVDEAYNIKNITKEKIDEEVKYWRAIKENEKKNIRHAKQAEVQLKRIQQIISKKDNKL